MIQARKSGSARSSGPMRVDATGRGPVILVPPNAEHLVAAGILAAALTGPTAPARVHVLSPIAETSAWLHTWLVQSPRQPVWILALDAKTIQEMTASVDGDVQARLASAGARILIGPADVVADPIRLITNVLDGDLGHPVDHNWRRVAAAADRRSVAMRRALHPPFDQPQTAVSVAVRRQALALVCSLTSSRVRSILEAWHIGGPAWEEARGSMGLNATDWHSDILDALHRVDAQPEDGVWSFQVVGFSATSARLRSAARQSVRQLEAGGMVLIAPHDRAEALRIAAVLAAIGRGADGCGDVESAEPERWIPGQKPRRGLALVELAEEAAAYAAAARNPKMTVLDVPPLDERSMDIPHIALAELWRLHRTAARPGAPRAGVDLPEQLAWLSTKHWPTGTSGLRRWLQAGLESDPSGSWLHRDDRLPEHPGLSGPLCLGHELTLDTATAQIVRWALGAHSQQRAALARLGIGTFRLPACVHGEHGQPRRLPPARQRP